MIDYMLTMWKSLLKLNFQCFGTLRSNLPLLRWLIYLNHFSQVTLLPSSIQRIPKDGESGHRFVEIESETGVVRNKIMLNRDVADGYTLKVGESCLRRIGKIFILKVFKYLY